MKYTREIVIAIVSVLIVIIGSFSTYQKSLNNSEPNDIKNNIQTLKEQKSIRNTPKTIDEIKNNDKSEPVKTISKEEKKAKEEKQKEKKKAKEQKKENQAKEETKEKKEPEKVPETPVTPSNPTPSAPTQEELNNQKRNQMQNNYGVKIRYANEMGDYRPRGLVPNKMTDPNRIKSYLNELNTGLSMYPNGFFKEMTNRGMPLTIYIVESVPGNAFSGLTDKEFYADIKLTLTTYGFFSRVMHHEIMHYIDAYLKIVMYPNSVEPAWNALNPPGYSYGSFIADYNYSYGKTGAYFINNYAQTNYLEDRASTFEDMMARVYAPPYYNNGEPIKNKGALIAKQIEDNFRTVSPSVTERWERYVK